MTTEGRPVLVGLEPGSSESTDAWRCFLDGHGRPGPAAAAAGHLRRRPPPHRRRRAGLPHSLGQRCLIHRARNVLAKVPAEYQAEVKKAYLGLFDDTGAELGEGAIAVVRGRADRSADAYAKRFPAAVDCLLADFASSTAYLRFPPATTPGSATPTSSSAPSARLVGGSRSSASSPASAPAWGGPVEHRPHQPTETVTAAA